MRRSSLLGLGVAVLLLACSRPRPSPEYERARVLWDAAEAERGGAAGDDPRTDEVLALLARVPGDSADAAAAAALRARVEVARRRHASARAPAGATPEAWGASRDDAAGGATPGEAPPEASVPPLAAGTTLDRFREQHGACFEPAGAVDVVRPGAAAVPAQMWVMREDARCRGAYPQAVGQAVLFVDGALSSLSPLTTLRRVEVRREVELVALPDGGTAIRTDGGVEPLPPGARILPSADGGAP